MQGDKSIKMSQTPQSIIKTFTLTSLSLIAFAANSVLCRMALGENLIDPTSFTIIRLTSGAIMLFLLFKILNKKDINSQNNSWLPPLTLFIYAITFSFAYITLDTGTGALILFGSVQVTIIALSILRGEKLVFTEWLGILTAFGGFVYLMLPGVTAPSLSGFTLMTISGVAWGVYTIIGKGSSNPLKDTAYNFIKTIPLILITTILLLTLLELKLTTKGIILALLSGTIASGIGYTIWYLALRGLASAQAAVVQLLVPLIALAGGVIFLSEEPTSRLLISAFLILGGILILVVGKYYFNKKVTN